ncbi:MAG: hypothetical protein DRP96_13045, partial [Candidatus Neomarinimicrobiota bacterium]
RGGPGGTGRDGFSSTTTGFRCTGSGDDGLTTSCDSITLGGTTSCTGSTSGAARSSRPRTGGDGRDGVGRGARGGPGGTGRDGLTSPVTGFRCTGGAAAFGRGGGGDTFRSPVGGSGGKGGIPSCAAASSSSARSVGPACIGGSIVSPADGIGGRTSSTRLYNRARGGKGRGRGRDGCLVRVGFAVVRGRAGRLKLGPVVSGSMRCPTVSIPGIRVVVAGSSPLPAGSTKSNSSPQSSGCGRDLGATATNRSTRNREATDVPNSRALTGVNEPKSGFQTFVRSAAPCKRATSVRVPPTVSPARGGSDASSCAANRRRTQGESASRVRSLSAPTARWI